ncbi:MAG: helicase C-terminal domain-containing protein, partial [Oscillospiraceae bacterium]
LKLTNDARKAGTDMRLYSPKTAFDPEGKIAKCCNNVFKHYTETTDIKGVQLIFSDIGTPNAAKFNVYDEVKRILIETGIPENEIAFIHDYKLQSQKQALYADMRNGSKRVLIGSTQKCGAGMNVQDRLIALHHIDCPYRPSDIEQREGRILRQGNMFSEVYIYRYVTKKSFDAYLWQLVEKKQRFISQIMSGKSQQRSCDEIDNVALSYAEVKTIATGNPLIQEKTEIEAEINKLNILKRQFKKEMYESQDRLNMTLPNLKQLELKKFNSFKKDIELHQKAENFRIVIGGEHFSERTKAGEALLQVINGSEAGDEKKNIGEFCGFDICVSRKRDSFQNDISKLILMKNGEYETTLGGSSIGNIIKIENLFNDIPFEVKKSQARLEEINKQEKQLSEIVKGSFQYDGKLTQLSSKLIEINMEIDRAAKQTTSAIKQTYAKKEIEEIGIDM